MGLNYLLKIWLSSTLDPQVASGQTQQIDFRNAAEEDPTEVIAVEWQYDVARMAIMSILSDNRKVCGRSPALAAC